MICRNCNFVMSVYNSICPACGELVTGEKTVEESINKPIKIGITAPNMRMGKTTVADYLCSKHEFKKVAFSETFKKMTRVLLQNLNISEERIERYFTIAKEEIIPEIGISTRWMWQSIGNEWGRDLIHENLWVMTALNKIRGNYKYVCEDIRRINEAEALRENGFLIIRVNNPRVTLERTHSSEGELDNYPVDYHIENDSTIEDLYKKVDNIIIEVVKCGQ